MNVLEQEDYKANEEVSNEVKPETIHVEYAEADAPTKVGFLGRQFGTVQAIDELGNHKLIPQPSDSPDDPLNWSRGYKQYLAALSCAAVLCCNLTGAGPSIAIVQQTVTWFGVADTSLFSKTAYLFTSAALANGIGILFFVPAITIWGRRPMYIIVFVLYLATLFWCAFARSYGSELAGRIVLGLASGAGECLGALTVNDLFFAHERGLYMAYYNVLLSCGAALGLIIDGTVTQNIGNWRVFYYVDIGIVGFVLVLVIFTFPETAFRRNELLAEGHGRFRTSEANHGHHVAKTRMSYRQQMRMFSGRYTQEGYWRMVARPICIVALPPVFFAALTFSATVGFLVAVTSNVAPAYEGIMGFSTQNTGFLFFGAIIGSLIGVPCGGWLGDKVSAIAVKRNHGLREPEHRLPAMAVPIITGPLSLILYGVCIGKKTHWMVGCLGLSLVNFTVCTATNIAMVYAIDCYKPIGDEVVTSILAWKAVIGFILSFYTNTWVTNRGYIAAYGQMAAIEGGLLLLCIPSYFWGKPLRRWSATWSWLQWAVRWDDDRDDLAVE